MSAGKFAAEFVLGIFRGVFSEEARERRQTKKARRRKRKGKRLTPEQERLLAKHGQGVPADEAEVSMALNTGLRTSTNTVVGTGVIGSIAVKLIELLPYPELVAALTTPEAVILWGSAIAWVVARFSKTPEQPKAL